MKKTILALSLTAVAATFMVSCSVKDKILDAIFTAFTAKVADYDVTIPAITDITNYQTINTQSVQFNLDSAIKAETSDQFSISNINTVTAEELTLTLNGSGNEAPDVNNNFANFEKIKVVMYSNTNSTPLTFEVPNNPDTYASTLSIPLDKTINLKSYLEGNTFFYNISAKARRETTHPLRVNVALKMKIDK